MIRAWWRGELNFVERPDRLDMLKAIFQLRRDAAAFLIPGTEAPELVRYLDDGGVEIPRIVIPLPSANSRSLD